MTLSTAQREILLHAGGFKDEKEVETFKRDPTATLFLLNMCVCRLSLAANLLPNEYLFELAERIAIVDLEELNNNEKLIVH